MSTILFLLARKMVNSSISQIQKCFSGMWGWSLFNSLTSCEKDNSPEHDDSDSDSDDGSKDDDDYQSPRPTGWTVGDYDIMVIITFVIYLAFVWLLQGFLVAVLYNGTIPHIIRGAGPMSLEVGIVAYVGVRFLFSIAEYA